MSEQPSEAITRLNAALEGRYRIESELGEGGMATVYLAEDLKHERKVAVKVLKPELAAVVGAKRFLAEIKTTANLQHPHILPLFDSGEADGLVFYVMPFVEGETLRDRLKRESQLPVGDAVRIAGEAAEALDYAHARGVIHRDVKPANILLQDGRVLVADFGIALAVRAAGAQRLTETGLSVGTPQYMSPEQAAGDQELDGRSDLYSLGCVTYEMLAGDPPHTASTAQAILTKVLTEEPRPLSQIRSKVPPEVEAAVHTALEKLAADRFGTAGEFKAALTSVGSVPVRPRPRRRRSGAAFVALSLVATAAGAFAVGLWASGEDGSTSPIGSHRQITFTGNAQMPAISPDGNRLAYTVPLCEENVCGSAIIVQDLVGGGLVVHTDLTSASGAPGSAGVSSIEWDGAGERLIYAIGWGPAEFHGVYTISWLGGETPRRLDTVEARAATERPTGRRYDWLAHPGGLTGSQVWRTLDLETDLMTEVELPFSANHLQWSPDGDLIAFISRYPTGTTTARPLISVRSHDGELLDSVRGPLGGRVTPRIRWSPGGDALLVIDGGVLRQVSFDRASGTLAREFDPVVPDLQPYRFFAGGFDVSNDGSRVVYGRPRITSTLITLERNGEGWKHERIFRGSGSIDFPAISRDGERIAFIAQDYLGENVYVRPFHGGQETALPSTDTRKKHLQWSPSGRYLGYLTEGSGQDLLTIVALDGSVPRNLGPVASHIAFPRWAWFSSTDSLVFFGNDGTVVVAGVYGPRREIGVLPASAELPWGFAVSNSGDSVAALSMLRRAGSEVADLVVYVAPMRGVSPIWSRVLSVPWDDLLGPPTRDAQAWPEWNHWSILGWRDTDLLVGNSARRNLDVYASLWAIPLFGGDPRELVNVTDACGAPAFMSVSADLSRIVCVRREVSRDIWMIDGLDLGPS